MEKFRKHSQSQNFAVFSEAVCIYFIGQIRLDAGDVEVRAKYNFLMCVSSAVMIVIRTCYQFYCFSTKSVKSVSVLGLFFNLKLVKEIHLGLSYKKQFVCPLYTLECNSGEKLIDTVASKHPDIKKSIT